MRKKIDEVDQQIISLLRADGRIPNTKIAKKLNISETTVRKRIRRLINDQFIQIVAVGNLTKLGYEFMGNLNINIDPKKRNHIISKLKKMKSIWYIARLTGSIDIDAEFSVKNQEELRTLFDTINDIDGILKLETSFRLEMIKNQYDVLTSGTELRSK